MVLVRALLFGVLVVTVPGDAFFLTMYKDRPNAMACRWYNMPAYANAINGQYPSNVGYSNQLTVGGGTGGLGSLNGLASMLTRLYPEMNIGSSQTRPRVVVRVEQTPNGNRNQLGTPVIPSSGDDNTNRELDYFDPDTGYYYEDDGDAYDDYSDPAGYEDTVTYYDMPAANVRQAGNVLQTWYGQSVGAPSSTGIVDPCSVCATSALLNFMMG